MLFSMFFAAANAQVAFDNALETPTGPEGIVILKDGTELKGKPLIAHQGRGNIKQITIKKEDKSKVKVKPEDIKSFRLKPNKLSKMANTNTSIMATATGANKSAWREYIDYLPAKLPNGKMSIMQHLNRGFDETIKIFADPKGRETAGVGVGGVQISGGLDKAYLVLKEGADMTFLVKKGKYEKQWDEIFGDCDAMQKPEDVSFRDFPGHVKMHMDKCGSGGGAEEEAPMEAEAPAAEAKPKEPKEPFDADPQLTGDDGNQEDADNAE